MESLTFVNWQDLDASNAISASETGKIPLSNYCGANKKVLQ